MKEKVIFNWSGGKDSALGLHRIMQLPDYEVIGLLTTISERYQRVSMHGVRVDLMEAQAASIGLPLIKVFMPDMPPMEAYEGIMTEVLSGLKAKGVTVAAFGDIFLADLREYRENKLSNLDLKALFPLWNIPTDRLIREFIYSGFRTITTCISEKHLDKSFAGRIVDDDFLRDLPNGVDPCGENGEFHTFVFDGPGFSAPVLFEKGEIVYRKYTSAGQGSSADDHAGSGDNASDPFDTGFWYCDLLLQHGSTIQ